jgi:hypothetical protein
MASFDRPQTITPPFPAVWQLSAELDGDPALPHLPGYPRILRNDRYRMLEFLENEYCSVDLDRIAGKLCGRCLNKTVRISPLSTGSA